MASAQLIQFSNKEKASIEGAVKEAKNLVDNNEKARQENLALVTGVLKNAGSRGLMLSHTHSWKGSFLATPPKIMGDGNAFVHQGAATKQGDLPVLVGSKDAIVYATFDLMYPGPAYLVAWYKPDNTNEDIKVYVEAGNSSRFSNIDWGKIEPLLDASHSRSRYWDSETGAAAAAEISSYGNKLALLGATFDRFKE